MNFEYKIFDTHSHYDDDAFNEDREAVLEQIKNDGVIGILNCACSKTSLKTTNELTLKHDFIYGALGIHPSDANDYNEDVKNEIIKLVNENKKILAIGEIGLDYYWDDVPSDKQKEVFQQQVDLAKKHQKPIIIHCRDAYEDTYEVLKRNGHPGIMHCYSGSVEMAKRFIDLGFYISLAGPVTFKNARVPKDVAEKIGLEHLLIETDCPYLTPHPYRGTLNEPANVVYIAQEIAKLKNMEIESVASQTTFNAKKVFGIK